MKIPYRPEIDGLRAIAVLAVIFYHLNLENILTGGYLGVDIFFVISGFLITSLILKELKSTGSFSFINFYKRRVRRLMPVFFVVLLSSSITAWLILLPSQLLSFSKSALSSIFFLSNHYWYSTSLEYEAQSSLLEPLLHTWSLSIEEQFYIVFPALLVLLFINFKKHFFSIILLLTIGSLFFAESYLSTDKSFCFYLLPTRFWELSAGSIIAILNYKEIRFKTNQAVVKNMSSLFLFTLIPCLFFFDLESNHPGLLTAIPVLSTMGILFFAHKEDFATKLLSTKPFVSIGLISYSLYLWHFPIFAFARNLNYENSPLDFCLWIALTFFLSFLSYKYIEQPFRNKAIIKTKRFIVTLISLLIILVTALSLTITEEGFPNRFSSLDAMYLGNEIDNQVLKDERDTFYSKVNLDTNFNDDNTNVLIIGDSHAKDLFLSFYLNQEAYKNYSFLKYQSGSWRNKSDDVLSKDEIIKKADIIIMCYRFANKSWIFSDIERFTTFLKEQNKRVIIALNIAEFESYGRDEVFDNHVKKHGFGSTDLDKDKIQSYFYESRKEPIGLVNDSILNFAKKMEIEYIDRYALVCDDESKRCKGITSSGKKTYTDGSHLSLVGAKYFGQELRKQKCLIETNFVSENVDAIAIDPNFNIGAAKEIRMEQFKEIFDSKAEFKEKLRLKKLSPEERKKFKKEEKEKLKKKRDELRKKLQENK